MNRAGALFGSALFLVIAPGTMAGVVPWLIGRWQGHVAWPGLTVIGGLLIVAGLPGLIDSFVRFAVQGLGTPAPLAPTRRLVVSGLYRYVRNPMYAAVTAVIFGQALWFGDGRIALYGAAFWLTCHAFVVLFEEPRLARDFGDDFTAYRAHVGRWIPRLTPWRAA